MTIFTAIALGSNIGKADRHIHEAFTRLKLILKDARLSPLYTSAPMYHLDQDMFVNAVATGYCDLSPHDLLSMLKSIENDMGREITFRNGPRLIDLDIILYGDKMVIQENLQIPHPRMVERPFVMRPLADLAPDFIHPVIGETMAALCGALDYTVEDLHALA